MRKHLTIWSPIALLLAVTLPVGLNAKKPANPGGDKNVSGKATFDSVAPAVGFDGDGKGSYVDGQLDGGWARFPGTGNFTLKTSGSGKKTIDRRKLSLFVPDLGLTLLEPAFLAVNDSRCDKDIDNNGDGSVNEDDCDDSGANFVANRGGLRDMRLDDEYFAQLAGNMDLGGGITLRWRCGPRPIGDGTIDPLSLGTQYFNVKCVEDNGAVCTKWRVAADLSDPGNSTRKCKFFEQDRKGAINPLGDVDVGMNLTIERL